MPTAKVVLENVFGMLGIIFWSFQLLPQVIDNYKAKTTEGLSASMFLFWTLASLGFGSYSIIEDLSIPIIVQPHVFGFFSTTCFLQCIYYNQKKRWSLLKTLVISFLLAVGFAGIEAAAFFGTRAGLVHDVKGTLDAAGILPVVLLGVGFIPQYIDILRLRSVVSVSMVFIGADASGSVFSLISLALRDTFDLLAALNYVIVFVCDMVIVAFYLYFNKYKPSPDI
ncbi:hypothetical protein BX616_000530 [Lobosporangium transversale]|uniref:PQ loop repeat-domain-containing protein n=1 Tax=Lobosporangium transversale TaxID=64571 RepID=A0A1Y2H2P5_9FUNG|nr:PQ loop repeat-domain-containing protein [Lobosporangium transversale]KAF9917592.1 hypothetical protein BX616_000530 [Lobosporangium transversale]ORZ28805.1 PQ loop repeat-domain-containing protein [Lobosporangium transversale]|eukprot:XP_021886478.1 PQ loop repeat-domain-containing protein [Lobosporangium transversale]